MHTIQSLFIIHKVELSWLFKDDAQGGSRVKAGSVSSNCTCTLSNLYCKLEKARSINAVCIYFTIQRCDWFRWDTLSFQFIPWACLIWISQKKCPGVTLITCNHMSYPLYGHTTGHSQSLWPCHDLWLWPVVVWDSSCGSTNPITLHFLINMQHNGVLQQHTEKSYVCNDSFQRDPVSFPVTHWELNF